MGQARFKYDLFVSYATLDDGTRRRVTRLVNNLQDALTLRLGTGQVPKIFFDKWAVSGGVKNLDEILTAVRQSALFLAVGSRNYVKRTWTRRELVEFVDRGDTHDHVYLAELIDVEAAQYPDALRAKIATRLWRMRDGGASREVPRTRYLDLVDDLAEAMSRRLAAMNEETDSARTPRRAASTSDLGGKDSAAPTAAAAKPATGNLARVLLAQHSEDVDDYARRLRAYLGQFPFEVEVVPRAAFSSDPAEFQAAFRSCLPECDVFAQLIGSEPSLAFPGGDLSADFFQAELARDLGLPVLQWRHPELDIAAVEDEAHRAFIDSTSFMTPGFRDFCSRVLAAARQSRAPEPPSGASPSASVFIDALGYDMDLAKSISQLFSDPPFSVALPLADRPPSEVRSHRREMFASADVLVLVDREDPVWVTNNLALLREAHAARKSPARAVAVCKVRTAEDDLPGDIRLEGVTYLDLSHEAGDDGEPYRSEPIHAFIRDLQS